MQMPVAKCIEAGAWRGFAGLSFTQAASHLRTIAYFHPRMPIITRTIWILSIASLLTDVASEMLYPVVPVYLKEIGFSVLWIGILEGIAELTVGLSKGHFGKISDERGQRLPFIKLGYFLSAISKPMMAIFVYPLWIFLARTTDRLGKGIRTAARDALLSQEATKQTKARVFGFHRGFDTAGAVIGSLIALLLLQLYPSQYKLFFFIAFIPGLLSVLSIFLLKEKTRPVATTSGKSFFSYLSYRHTATREYKQLVIGLLLFALANSSDLFLILKTKAITGSDTSAVFAYVLYNLVYAICSYPMGALADRFGMKKIFLFGLILFMLVYAGFAFATTAWMAYALFALYGVYAAATERIAKAWITNIAHDKDTATAVGFFTSCQSIAAFMASILAGFIWQQFGSTAGFLLSSALTTLAIIWLAGRRFNKYNSVE
jgi:MFS family permease